jgi:hypothetical protein
MFPGPNSHGSTRKNVRESERIISHDPGIGKAERSVRVI